MTLVETISHHFGGGAYLKIWRIKDATAVPQHRHKFEHLTAVMSGCVMVEVEGEENKVIYAPDAITVKEGVTHTFTALNGDAVVGCIHSVDGLLDVDIEYIDNSLILKD